MEFLFKDLARNVNMTALEAPSSAAQAGGRRMLVASWSSQEGRGWSHHAEPWPGEVFCLQSQILTCNSHGSWEGALFSMVNN